MERIRRRGGDILFVVRLTPKGGRDRVDGWRADAAGREQLAARVTAPPEDGKANAALIALLAKTLDIAKTTLEIVAGSTARVKTVAIHAPPPETVRRLEHIGAAH